MCVLVSVVIPTFNRPILTLRAIQSVQGQTEIDWELIVVDDGSDIESFNIVNRYIASDNRCKIISNASKKGPAGARNTGIMNATGNYIAFLDSDDVWMSHHLKDSIDLLKESNHSVAYSYWKNNIDGIITNCDSENFTTRLKLAIEKYDLNDNQRYLTFPREYIGHFLCNGLYCFHINTLIIKKEVVQNIGLFNTDLFGTEDLEFSIRLIEQYGFILVRNYHFHYYTITDSDSLFAFIDRDNITLEKISSNELMVRKICKNIVDKVKYLKMARLLVLKSKLNLDKKIIFSLLKRNRIKKNFTILALSLLYGKFSLLNIVQHLFLCKQMNDVIVLLKIYRNRSLNIITIKELSLS